MKSPLGCLFLLAALSPVLPTVPALANQFRRVPLREQMAKADVVIVGRVSLPQKCRFEGHDVSCVEVTDVVYIRGKTDVPGKETVSVITYSRAEESSFSCCKKRGTYIFVLREWHGQLFPVNGQWSLIRLFRGTGPDILLGDTTFTTSP